MTSFIDTILVKHVKDTITNKDYYRLTVLNEYFDVEFKCMEDILKKYRLKNYIPRFSKTIIEIKIVIKHKSFWQFICDEITLEEYNLDSINKELHLKNVYSYN